MSQAPHFTSSSGCDHSRRFVRGSINCMAGDMKNQVRVRNLLFRKLGRIGWAIDRPYDVGDKAVSELRLQCPADDATTGEHRGGNGSIPCDSALAPGAEKSRHRQLPRLLWKCNCRVVDEKLVVRFRNAIECLSRLRRLLHRRLELLQPRLRLDRK